MKLYALRIQYISDCEFCGVFTTPTRAEDAKRVANRTSRDVFDVVEIEADAFIGNFNSLPSIEEHVSQ